MECPRFVARSILLFAITCDCLVGFFSLFLFFFVFVFLTTNSTVLLIMIY